MDISSIIFILQTKKNYFLDDNRNILFYPLLEK